MTGSYYVYALKDPRVSPAKPFYIGKGTGTRAHEHVVSVDGTPKGQRILDIHASGKSVLVTILLDSLTELQALKVEAELISAFGIEANGGLLANSVFPSGNGGNLRPDFVLPSGVREKASIGLQLLKDCIFELAKANPHGITNGEAAISLGLKSDYKGGAKDYLTFSVIGLLLSEGKLQRNDDLGKGRYVASAR